MANDRREAIAARAYELWMEGDYQRGQDAEHWLRAERELAGVAASESVTGVDQRHGDRPQGLTAQNDEPGILHRVPNRRSPQ